MHNYSIAESGEVVRSGTKDSAALVHAMVEDKKPVWDTLVGVAPETLVKVIDRLVFRCRLVGDLVAECRPEASNA